MRNTLHAIDLKIDGAAPRKRIVDVQALLLVHHVGVNHEPARRREALPALIALQVLQFLVLHECLLVRKLTLAVEAPDVRFGLALRFATLYKEERREEEEVKV